MSNVIKIDVEKLEIDITRQLGIIAGRFPPSDEMQKFTKLRELLTLIKKYEIEGRE